MRSFFLLKSLRMKYLIWFWTLLLVPVVGTTLFHLFSGLFFLFTAGDSGSELSRAQVSLAYADLAIGIVGGIVSLILILQWYVVRNAYLGSLTPSPEQHKPICKSNGLS
jgi:hypothetical protein